MSQRPGFMSVTGIVLAAALLVGVAAWMLIAGDGFFSPGELNTQTTGKALGGVTSHAGVGRDCGACHTAPWSSQTMAERCLVCHTNVTQEMQSRSGLHGKLEVGLATPTCRGCHTDHHGPAGALTVGNMATFPHELTGYSLRGHQRTSKGARFTCADCHPQGLAQFDQATCARCHEAIAAGFMAKHEASFGKDCLACHDGTGAKFDHGKLPFKLVGKHSAVPCDKCHPNATTLADLKKTPQDCYACHAKDDQHKGAFSRQCGQCHTPATWGDAKFDHTIFPVNHGAEETKATCQTCHPRGTSTYTCFGCHAHTPANVVGEHEGKSLAQIQDCIQCHQGGRKGGD